MNKIIIDTNIYSNLLRGNNEVIANLQQVSYIGISVISIGELLSGFEAGNRIKENRNELGQFLDSPRVAICLVDVDTIEHYSAILNKLKKNGTPIPTNDIWIAAVALQHGLPLYTLDKHFSYVEGLLLR
ncbi:MAG: type II toxin-antitoxin system VapC family toxin [Thermodesulfobacteriota bacterium]|nr:type II toxin-antitoxin system VapC family toxin [Thermodesulfobacteriota bacterium]